MPEVIDLLSSTPPPPINLPRLSSITAPRSSPPPFAAPQSFLSDEYDSVFNYDDFDKPTKRRRLSDDPEYPKDVDLDPKPTTNPLFLFSDDSIILPAEGGPSGLKQTSTRRVEDSDPIVFTSSGPEPAGQASHLRETTYPRTNTITIDDDGDFPSNDDHAFRKDDIEDFSDHLVMPDINELLSLAGRTTTSTPAAHPLFSNRTASLLAGLENRSKPSSKINGSGGGMEAKTTGRSRKGKENECKEVLSDEVVEPRKPGRKTSKVNTVDKEAKAREREAAKAQREHERQLEKERKQKLKEEKAREKQIAADLAEVNKLKVDKKESMPEMIIDLASSLEGTSVGNQSVGYIERLGAEHTFFTSSIPNIIKWRRKVKAKFNETAGYWEPCPLQIQEENHVMCLLTAQELVDMVVGQPDAAIGTNNKLALHVRRIQTAYPHCKPIYLIEGLTAWMRKNQNSRNRAYQAEVRRQFDQNQNQDPSTTRPSRKKTTDKPETTAPVDDDTIEAALLDLQVTHSCLIHHTHNAPESAEWIKNFTEHISTVPYRRERMDGNDSAFCMDSGQVGIGEDKSDTFVKMLQEINRVTASMAYGIVGRYPSVVDLVQGMRRHGPAMLEDVKKSANKNGALTDSRLGPAASKRLYKVFMGLDPSSTDI